MTSKRSLFVAGAVGAGVMVSLAGISIAATVIRVADGQMPDVVGLVDSLRTSSCRGVGVAVLVWLPLASMAKAKAHRREP